MLAITRSSVDQVMTEISISQSRVDRVACMRCCDIGNVSVDVQSRGFIKFLCRRSVLFFSPAFLVYLVKESKKRRRKQPGKLIDG